MTQEEIRKVIKSEKFAVEVIDAAVEYNSEGVSQFEFEFFIDKVDSYLICNVIIDELHEVVEEGDYFNPPYSDIESMVLLIEDSYIQFEASELVYNKTEKITL
jgi:hypothetical protein